MALAPSLSVVPSISMAVGIIVNVSEPTTRVLDGKAPEGIANVEDAITRPAVPSETAVPDMVTADPPAVRVVPSMSIAEGFAVKVWPPRVKTWIGPTPGEDPELPSGGGVGTGIVEVPMTRPLGP